MRYLAFLTLVVLAGCSPAEPEATVLFDGSSLDGWLHQPGGWVITDEGAMVCQMTPEGKAMGDIWTEGQYGDFDLTLDYQLSEGANSGVFYRGDKDNPVQGGFEVQLMDNVGFQKSHGEKDARKLNGSFYDGVAPSHDPSNSVGEWNSFRLTCEGPIIQIAINGEQVVEVNVDEWTTAGQNPDGTTNKFKTALAELPRIGRIGFQNHGQVVQFRDVKIRPR